MATASTLSARLRQVLSGQKGVLVAFLIVAVVALFLIPIPRYVLDILLVVNIVLSLTILLRGVFVTDVTQLFAFPMLIVLTTLFRLALNVSSTRLILLYGHEGRAVAGRVIEAFGSFVVQGNFVVGAIVFSIIALVNFAVITRGSARVAEVAARFTLDALPGRQLAIDSDFRAATISREEAQNRRAFLAQESHFYGAMDGAMRFVQGDAIATLIIVFVNAVGGVALGVTPARGLSFAQSVDNFGVLAIGDGLVSIIPSLLISVCAGIAVTSVSRRGAHQPASQALAMFFTDPRALAIAAASLILFGLIPGFPLLPFGVVGLILLVWSLGRIRQEEAKVVEEQQSPPPLVFREAALVVDPRRYTQWESEERRLSTAYQRESDQLFRRRGMPLPAAAIISDPALGVGEYQVIVRERVLRRGRLPENAVFVPLAAQALGALSIAPLSAAEHPLDGRAGAWIAREQAAVLQTLGVEPILPEMFLALLVVGALLESASELFGVNEVRQLLSTLEREQPHVVEEVIGAKLITIAELAEVLRRLIHERVSIRDLKLILEGVAEFGCSQPNPTDRTAWLEDLHEFLRKVLARAIITDCLPGAAKLRAFVLSAEAEEEFRSAASAWDSPRSKPPLDPAFEQSLRSSTRKLFAPVLERGALPVVLLCSAEVRPAVDDFLSRELSANEWYRTVAYEELSGRFETEAVGVLAP